MPDRMDESFSSEVIQFPGRVRPSIDSRTRLDRAFCALNQARNELRENISGLRAGLNAVTAKYGEIGENLQSLDTRLAASLSQLQHFSKEELESGHNSGA